MSLNNKMVRVIRRRVSLLVFLCVVDDIEAVMPSGNTRLADKKHNQSVSNHKTYAFKLTSAPFSSALMSSWTISETTRNMRSCLLPSDSATKTCLKHVEATFFGFTFGFVLRHGSLLMKMDNGGCHVLDPTRCCR